MSEIKLGVWAKDKITGFTGFVTSKHTSFSGTIQYGVQPHNDKGDRILDPMSFDVNHLEFIDKGVSETVPVIPNIPFRMAQKVRDKLTGFTGNITSSVTYLNGCTHFVVTSRVNILQKAFGFTPASQRFEWQRLESVDDRDVAKANNKYADEPIIPVAAATAAATTATPAQSQPVPPGGPNDRVPSSRMD